MASAVSVTSSRSPLRALPTTAAAAPVGILRLERFLESVLKRNLDTALSERDALYSTVAQCAQLRWLMDDMKALSRYHSFISASSAAEAAPVAASTSAAAAVTSSSSAAPLRSTRDRAEAYQPPQRNKILVDVGHYFYTPGIVKDAQVVYLNLGCGVVLPMSLDEARRFLDKKEAAVRQSILRKSKEALRIKYRIRLVTEAIARLNERHLGL